MSTHKVITEAPGSGVHWPLDPRGDIAPFMLPDGRRVRPFQQCIFRVGTNTPEGAVSARVGSIFLRTNGGASTTLYVKESGTGNTGWVAK